MDWNGGIANSANIRSKGHNIACLMDNFGIQVDANNKFNGDECTKWPVVSMVNTVM